MGWDPGKVLGDATGIEWNPAQDASNAYDKLSDFTYDNRGVLAIPIIGILSAPLGIILAGGALANTNLANEILDVITGEYAREQKAIAEAQKNYDDKMAEYEDAIDVLQSKYVIDDEIFQLAANNKLREIQERYTAELKTMADDLQKMVDNFNTDYKNFQSVLDDKYMKYFMWVPLVVGGLVSDVSDLITKGDWEAGRRALNIAEQVIGLIITIVMAVAATIASGGTATPFTVALIVSAITQLVALVITLDSIYGQGLIMNGVFSMLDILLNDVMDIDGKWEELGTGKLSDTQYYEELTGYVSIINTIVGTIAGLVAVFSSPPAGLQAQIASTSPLLSSAMAVTSSLPYRTLSTIYEAAMLYEDYQKQEEALEAFRKKSIEDIDKLNAKIQSAAKRKMIQSYREEEQMLTGTSNIISEYAMSSFDNPTSSFDPEMTIAANYGYEYSGDNIMDFIPEYTINYEELAGGVGYEDKILYKTN